MKKIILLILCMMLIPVVQGALVWNDSLNTATVGHDTTWTAVTDSNSFSDWYVSSPLSLKGTTGGGGGGYWIYRYPNGSDWSAFTEAVAVDIWINRSGASQLEVIQFDINNVTYCGYNDCMNFGMSNSGGTNFWYNCIGDGGLTDSGVLLPQGAEFIMTTEIHATNVTFLINDTTTEVLIGSCSTGHGFADIERIHLAKESSGTNHVAWDNLTVRDFQAPPVASINYSADPFLFSENDVLLSDVDEDTEFFIAINHTTDGIINSTANCTYTASNITIHKNFLNDSNFTLTSSTQYLEALLSEKNTTTQQEDKFEFRLCHAGAVTVGAEFYINGTNYFNVSQEIIPNCDVGFHEEDNESTEYINENAFNFTIKCANCGGQRQLRIVQENGSIFHWERELLLHSMNTTYNSSTGYYENRTHLHHFFFPGINASNITTFCNDTANTTKYFTVGNVNLTVVIVEINELNWSNGTSIESQENVTIIVDAYGDEVNSRHLNVSYFNGTVIRTTDQEFINLTNAELNVDGVYNVTYTAYDDEDNPSTVTGWFMVNDTTNPVITWTLPLSDNSSQFEIDTTTQFRADISDLNLFAYEYVIRNALGTLIRNTSVTGITQSSVTILETVNFNQTGNWSINLTVADDHTAQFINDIPHEIKNSEDLLFKVERGRTQQNVSIRYMGQYGLGDIDIQKEEDRYTFAYDFNYLEDRFLKEVRHNFRIECDNLYYRDPSISDYACHFVCWDSRTWLDFESDSLNSCEVEDCGIDCYDVTLYTKPDNIIQFNSLGGLNEISEEVTFQVVPEVPTNATLGVLECPTNLEGVGILWLFVALAVVVFVIGLVYVPLLAPFGGLGMFLVSFTLVACSTLSGTTFIIISVVMFLVGCFRLIMGVVDT